MNAKASKLNAYVFVLFMVALIAGCNGSDSTQTQPQAAAPEPDPEPTVRTLRLAQTWAEDAPIFAETTANFAEMVSELSGGELAIEVVSADEHQKPFGIFEMVQSGEYDLGHSASYYWGGIDPNTLFFTTLPFGMLPQEQYAWFYYGGGMELMHRVYSQYGLRSFPGGNTGNQMGGWFKEEIKSLEDLEGLKMRIPGFAGEVLKELGVEPVNLAPPKLYDALNEGRIDALEWVGPSLDLGMKFHEIARYYYTGWHEPATELQFLMNEQSWKQLPEHFQKILTIAMRTAAYDMYAQSTYESAKNWGTIQVEYPGVEIRTFPPEVLEAMYEKTKELLKKRASEDSLARSIHNSQSRFLWEVRRWTQISEQAYLNSQPRGGGVNMCEP